MDAKNGKTKNNLSSSSFGAVVGSGIKHPGSATLMINRYSKLYQYCRQKIKKINKKSAGKDTKIKN
jgi:hypothetical protein